MASRSIVRKVGTALLGLVLLAGTLLFAPHAERSHAGADSCWEASITEQWNDYDLAGSVLRVAVRGQAGLKVTVREKIGGYETWNWTGTKPEYGPFVTEFAALSKATYVIEPEGLGKTFEVWLDGKNYTRVDFTKTGCPPTATATPTATRRPPATRQATATRTPAAPATATPAVQWRARVVERQSNPTLSLATIAVRVIGRPAGQVVTIESGSFSASTKTGTKPELTGDTCEFGGLTANRYTITPDGLGISYAVTVSTGEYVLVEFYSVGGTAIPRWVGKLKQNTSGSTPTEGVSSAIAVIVTGRPWIEVEIRAGGWTATCVTGTKPDIAAAACEFGGLRAGTYTLAPKGLEASVQVTVDGLGWALVQFDPVAAPAPPAPTPRPTATPGSP